MPEDPEDIVNWQRLGPEITTSGRLVDGDVTRLSDLGVRQVINLALADSPGALADEAALLDEAGIAYVHIPVPFDAPEESQFDAFRRALETSQRPVHVHCIANYRVSAFFYRWHREHGMDKVAARALMEKQWTPEKGDHRDGGAWARFVAQGEL